MQILVLSEGGACYFQGGMKRSAAIFYPKPGPMGGRLVREVIGLLREGGVQVPISSHILIAISGGPDSVALAHLLIHFGRRICLRNNISLIHVNHRWRREQSDQDEAFVAQLAKTWSVPLIIKRLKPPVPGSGESWEEQARESRKRIFEKEASKRRALVLTAHQADDLAETVLWRLLTGAASTHSGGIAIQTGIELRPFLTTRKARLLEYLKECEQNYRQDETNFSDRFLRARMRKLLMPEMEKLFPRSVEHLVEVALKAQEIGNKTEKTHTTSAKKEELPDELALQRVLFGAAGLKVRRAQWELIAQKGVAKKDWSGEIHLPGGWRLTCEARRKSRSLLDSTDLAGDSQKKWILEKI